MQKRFLELLLKMSTAMRRKRMAKLTSCFSLADNARILDVGGSGDWNWDASGLMVSVTVINLYPPEDVNIPNYIQGDACDMHMFRDGEFDLVFSNSVIEHLPSKEHQRRMAKEIQRVGKAYWVQTPNKHFPLELHLCFPFIQYLPVKWGGVFGRTWPFSFEKMRGRTEGAVADAQALLLTGKQLQALFPGCTLVRERFLGMAKSLVAYRG